MTPDQLLTHLITLAAANLPCSSNSTLATALKTGRSAISRALNHLENKGAIERRGSGWRRTITIAATGARTSTPRRQAPQRPPTPSPPPPPCAVCGDPVEKKSGKFPRSCAKPSCRACVHALAYGGTLEDVPWPVVTGVVPTDFAPHTLTFRPDVRRTPGLPFTRSYGVSSAYERPHRETA